MASFVTILNVKDVLLLMDNEKPAKKKETQRTVFDALRERGGKLLCACGNSIRLTEEGKCPECGRAYLTE